jgi:hypothetical protein
MKSKTINFGKDWIILITEDKDKNTNIVFRQKNSGIEIVFNSYNNYMDVRRKDCFISLGIFDLVEIAETGTLHNVEDNIEEDNHHDNG